jgi:acetolactate decarboxylase
MAPVPTSPLPVFLPILSELPIFKSMLMRKILLIFATFILLYACSKKTAPEKPAAGTLVQVSVIDALLQGFYDGFYSLDDLKQHGNFGIGTFDGLDGELVLFNDTVFQVPASGVVSIPNDDALTPFAAVTFFEADTTFRLNEVSFDSIRNGFDSFFPTPNIFYVIRMKGEFSTMRTRSVPKQSKPYPGLAEVTRTQPEFDFQDVNGDVIGFYCPEYAKGINVTGLHLHFLNSQRTAGGHILDFELKSGTMEIGYLLDYRLLLPPGGDFYGGDFSVDRSKELEAAEQ